MIDHIVVFCGSKKDFEDILAERIHESEDTIPFMELIQHYNARLRPNDSSVRESEQSRIIKIDKLHSSFR